MSTSLHPSPATTARSTAPPLLEHVVLLDARGRPRGSVPKQAAHTTSTPLHLAFSCHIVRPGGDVLLTRRARQKPTWPGAWTNGCCGHPQLGESLREAVTRRLGEELGLVPTDLALAIPDFAYRAQMPSGIVEHELCPVVVATVAGVPRPDPAEVEDVAWVSWDALCERAHRDPGSLSPWCVEQVAQLAALGPDLAHWLDAAVTGTGAARLDEPVSALWAGPASRAVGGEASAALDGLRAPLHRVLDEFLAAKADALVAIDASLAVVADEVRSLVGAGGKRLRPAFVHWGHRATGADHDDAVLRAAAAVELLHTFALLHDDVMDRSAVRRGRPSAHAALAEQHRHAARRGDSDWFGTSAAVLAGDLTFVWADELFDSTDLPPEVLGRAREVFTTLRTEVIAGQYLDLALAADPAAVEGAARNVALLKSARYTVTRPLLLGAALAPTAAAGAGAAPALQAYGDAVGLAFQMRDDILGLFGDPDEMGKSALDDLREGKRTLLVLRALRLATPAGRRLLAGSLGDPDLDAARADRIRTVVAESGALASVETLLAAQHALALDALTTLPEPARSALEELAGLAIQRRS